MGSRHSSYRPAADPGDAEDTDYPIMCLLVLLLCGGSEQLISCAVKYNLLLYAAPLQPISGQSSIKPAGPSHRSRLSNLHRLEQLRLTIRFIWPPQPFPWYSLSYRLSCGRSGLVNTTNSAPVAARQEEASACALPQPFITCATLCMWLIT